MTRKGYSIIGLYILGFIFFTALGFILAEDQIIGPIIGLALAGVASIGSLLFKPIRELIERFVAQNMPLAASKCRVLFVGLGRSGKTSIIRHILTEDSPKQEISTETFDIYDETMRIGLKNPTRYVISVADYKGQKLSQITVNKPTAFFGAKGKRQINAVIFVVDLFPEISDESGRVKKDFDLIEEYKSEAIEKIQSRIANQKEYITKYTIEQIFEAAYNSAQMYSVRLFINKVDLLRSIIERGYLPEIENKTAEEFGKKLYASTIYHLEQACAANNIDDFSVHFVSAKTGENLQPVFSEIVETYHRRQS